MKGRYGARRPGETLAFFGLEPGMTVVEATPEGGWYTRILLPYLGSKGRLIGADYSMELYQLFDYYSEEELADKETWARIGPARSQIGIRTARPLPRSILAAFRQR